MNCKQCGDIISANKRDDTLFCDQNCKQKHYKRRKKIINRITQLSRAIISERDIIAHWKQKVDTETKERNEELDHIRKTIASRSKSLELGRKVLRLNTEKFLDFLESKFQSNPDKYWHELEIFRYGTRDILTIAENQRKIYKYGTERIEKEIKTLETRQMSLKLETLFNSKTELGQRADTVIEKCENDIEAFEDELEELKQIDLDRLPIIPKRIKRNQTKRVSSSRAYSGSEIANLDFKYVVLNGELGRFLGKLERNKCAIALTGDSGAGKSTFSYSLADGFVELQQSVGYFSLESGFTNKFKKFAKRHALNRNFKAFEEATLKDVRTEAKNFDCLIIDSFSKISNKAADFEGLRQDFPDTYFIIIFQKTTDGKIRGGSSILFNSTATIDIQVDDIGNRQAVMVKSRYDTENFIYSITEDQLIKSDKLPL